MPEPRLSWMLVSGTSVNVVLKLVKEASEKAKEARKKLFKYVNDEGTYLVAAKNKTQAQEQLAWDFGVKAKPSSFSKY